MDQMEEAVDADLQLKNSAAGSSLILVGVHRVSWIRGPGILSGVQPSGRLSFPNFLPHSFVGTVFNGTFQVRFQEERFQPPNFCGVTRSLLRRTDFGRNV